MPRRRTFAIAFAGTVGALPSAATSPQSIPAAASVWDPYPSSSTSDQAMTYQLNPAHSGSTGTAALTVPLQPSWTIDLGGPVSYPLMGGYVYVTVTNPATT